MITLSNAPIPGTEALCEIDPKKNKGWISNAWAYFLTTLLTVLGQATKCLGSSSKTDQTASIGATDLTDGTFGAGMYRLTYYARVTRAATTSSSLQVTLSWTDHGITLTSTLAAMTGNTTSTVQQGGGLIYSDGGQPVTYSTTYASTGATSMSYEIFVALEQVSV